jgi:predicted dehydrogenase
VRKERARKLAAEFDVPHVAANPHQVLRAPDVDAVSICTDHASHAALAVKALRAGKHLLCEKPLAHRGAGLDAMLREARARPAQVCAAVFQHRFETLNRRLREAIAAGALGRMLTAGMRLRCWRAPDYYRSDPWRGTWAREGGSAVINQAIHYVDLLSWIMGGVRDIAGCHANLTHQETIETEDTAAACVTFTNGALGTIEVTASSCAGWESTLFFQGTEGCVELFKDAVARVELRDQAAGERLLAELRACHGATLDGPGKTYYGAGHAAQIADFVEAVRDARAPFVTFASAAETVDLVLGLYRSARTRRQVALQPRAGGRVGA